MNDTVYKLRIAKFNNAHLSDVKKTIYRSALRHSK